MSNFPMTRAQKRKLLEFNGSLEEPSVELDEIGLSCLYINNNYCTSSIDLTGPAPLVADKNDATDWYGGIEVLDEKTKSPKRKGNRRVRIYESDSSPDGSPILYRKLLVYTEVHTEADGTAMTSVEPRKKDEHDFLVNLFGIEKPENKRMKESSKDPDLDEIMEYEEYGKKSKDIKETENDRMKKSSNDQDLNEIMEYEDYGKKSEQKRDHFEDKKEPEREERMKESSKDRNLDKIIKCYEEFQEKSEGKRDPFDDLKNAEKEERMKKSSKNRDLDEVYPEKSEEENQMQCTLKIIKQPYDLD